MFDKPKIIKIPKCLDERGQINFFEIDKEIDFAIKRVYYISNVPNGQERGKHAHKELKQLMLAASGEVEIELDDGKNKYNFKLNSLNEALYVPKGFWRVLKIKEKTAVIMVFASQIYDEADYIFDYNEFLQYANDKF
jgi:dTDP-4-dehydrorhamnose 3,5-epimerase-like enzyme